MKISVFTTVADTPNTFWCNTRIQEPGLNDIFLRLEVNTAQAEENGVAAREHEVIAELVAIQHSLFHSGYFNSTTLKSVEMVTSSGRVKKVIQGRALPALTRYAAPILLRIESLKVLVDNQQPAWFSPSVDSRIRCDRLHTSTHIPAIGSMGELVITATAVSHFTKAGKHATGRDLKALIRTLQKELHPVSIPAHIMANKKKKYGHKALATEHWSSDNESHVFVIQQNRTQRTLVSCFSKCA